MLAGLLIVGAVVLVATNIKEVREINIFAVVLVIQSLPFIAAVALGRDRAHAAQRFRHLAHARGAPRRAHRPAPEPAPAPAPVVTERTELVP